MPRSHISTSDIIEGGLIYINRIYEHTICIKNWRLKKFKFIENSLYFIKSLPVLINVLQLLLKVVSIYKLYMRMGLAWVS